MIKTYPSLKKERNVIVSHGTVLTVVESDLRTVCLHRWMILLSQYVYTVFV